MATTPAANGSYLQQADPQTFPVHPTGVPPPNNYQAPAASATAQPEQQTQTLDVPKDEVGWYFVEQYYTTLNKSPDRVHLFYNKRSSMVWGTEGESLPLAHGRTDIQEKIAAHEFKDCKVRVSNVDSQASAGNGIVIQVLGEMSNNGLPNRKFSQTFFLAEQPNGYYVLNDIFRYLKDDDDIEEGEEYDYTTEDVPQVAEEIVAEAAPVPVVEETVQETPAAVVEAPVVEKKVEVEEPAVVEPIVAAEPEVAEETVAPVNGTAEPVVEEAAAVEPEAEVVVEAPAVVEEEKAVEEVAPAPAVVEEKAAPVAPAPVKKAAPLAPAPAPVPKTWASLVAAKPAAPVVQAPVAPAAAATVAAPVAAPTQAPVAAATPAVAATPAATPAAPVVAAANPATTGWQTADSKRRPHVASSAVPAGQTTAYVKNVTEAVTEQALKTVLNKFGTLKSVEVIRNKNCAFVEFDTPSAFTAANAANPHMIGGSNVLVEERRRPVNGSYGRGNLSNRGDGRPASQGRGFPPRGEGQQRFEGGRGGRGGRGGFAPRGGVKTPTPGN